ncbi:MAG: DNA repair protein RecO [Burkholderiaceae bacterium]|nr:DNA repair protein RecO [Burkholderiaceae bacterium]MCD8517571.1 DNA repair protein RecO [Burkholderiaceae bacterium]MCD8537367.1 DNA repair protein RecO [Burkholderiaceae bacterium]MCD8564585.1 DNA repair protein RecO [Burkholderiaceae bacterium]
MSKRSARIVDAQAFVLQSTAWRETSLIVKVFSRDYGVVTLVAKGAKRPYSGLRAVLMPFQQLALSWTGNAEVKTLTHADVTRVQPVPGAALMSCWYMNELLLRLLAAEDPHPGLFEAYAQTIDALSQGKSVSGALRQFEWRMLRETGYGMDGPEPDFDDRSMAATLREQFQQRLLEQVPGGRLNSREVMLGLRRLADTQGQFKV